MSTLKDFKNAPGGAIATSPYGGRAMKVYDGERHWITSRGIHLNDKEMVQLGYTLGPALAPTTVREAIDLAWELAHEVKEGQHIPEGVRLLDRFDGNDFSVYTTLVGFTSNARDALTFRTLDPLPVPDPDWLDAPAVIATTIGNDNHRTFANVGNSRWYTPGEKSYLWTDLTDVTPIYPEE